MPWRALLLEVDPREAEHLSERLLEAGALSVTVDDPEGRRCTLSALLELDRDPAALVGELFDGAPPYRVALVEDDDWVRRTQAQFPPQRFGERLWVGPTWHEPPAGIAAAVRLDPGMAFGTGSHPSTRLVLRFLEANVRGGERVLDYGCGSGILAIAAAKLGAARVEGVDIDPEALLTAQANARANGVALATALPEEAPAAGYDLVVANILAQPLILLAPLLAAKTARGGRIALSGILDSQAEEVAQAYAAAFDCGVRRREEGWSLVEGTRR